MNWPEVVRDRVVGQRRLAEVALHEMLQIDQVAERERLVEAVVLIEGLDGSRVGGGLLAEVRRGGVARDELGQHEGDERDPEQEQEQRGKPAQEEAAGTIRSGGGGYDARPAGSCPFPGWPSSALVHSGSCEQADRRTSHTATR